MTKSKKNTKKPNAKFRSNVCIALRKKGTELFLVGHRKGYPRDKGWQFPQGGIEPGCDFLEEMKRELREEIGTDSIKVIRLSPEKYTYTFPPEYAIRRPGFIGQKQRWVLAEYAGDDSGINCLHEPAEFDAFQWKKTDEILDIIVTFKKNVYARAMNDLGIIKKQKQSPQ